MRRLNALYALWRLLRRVPVRQHVPGQALRIRASKRRHVAGHVVQQYTAPDHVGHVVSGGGRHYAEERDLRHGGASFPLNCNKH